MKRRKEKNTLFKKISLDFFKEHKKISVCIVLCMVFISSFLVINYGRYVKDVIQLYYLRTQNFYFSSNRLTIHGKEYEITPWEGTQVHEISISMSSMLNSLKGTTTDIEYNISCETDGQVDCYISTTKSANGEALPENLRIREQKRTITTEEHADNFIIAVANKNDKQLKDGDRVKVTVKAESTYPYKETLSATFILVVGNYGVSYKIEDAAGDIYFDTIITNTSETEKATIKLEITNPSIVAIDMSNNVLNIASKTTTMVKAYKDDNGDGIIDSDAEEHEYINSITFEIEPTSSMMVRFYKKKVGENYSYVNGDIDKEPIVKMTVE